MSWTKFKEHLRRHEMIVETSFSMDHLQIVKMKVGNAFSVLEPAKILSLPLIEDESPPLQRLQFSSSDKHVFRLPTQCSVLYTNFIEESTTASAAMMALICSHGSLHRPASVLPRTSSAPLQAFASYVLPCDLLVCPQ